MPGSDPTRPPACRSGIPNTVLSVSDVSIATVEQSRAPSHAPVDFEIRLAAASSLNRIVTSPRERGPLSYSRHFLTRYPVLSAGWTTLDFTAGMHSAPRKRTAELGGYRIPARGESCAIAPRRREFEALDGDRERRATGPCCERSNTLTLRKRHPVSRVRKSGQGRPHSSR